MPFCFQGQYVDDILLPWHCICLGDATDCSRTLEMDVAVSTDELRSFYAKMMACSSGSTDPRLERIFELVPREAFLGTGPWQIQVNGMYIETPSADLSYIYQNNLIALDASMGINNGEPLLHARWIGSVAPQAGETVTHIGAGTGYYTAILSMLVRPGGQVFGVEMEPELAAAAQQNLIPFDTASVTAADAVAAAIQPSDIIYVNAGVLAPPQHWLKALRPGGRMIFPWRPSSSAGLALLVKRERDGYSAKPIMTAWFIPCVGASLASETDPTPHSSVVWQTRSVHLTSENEPNDSAVAVYDDVWFSTAAVSD